MYINLYPILPPDNHEENQREPSELIQALFFRNSAIIRNRSCSSRHCHFATPLGGLKGVHVEIIKEALMQWGEAMNLTMENRTLFYSPVLNHWRVKKWTGKNAKSFIYEGDSFMLAFEYLLGTHTTEHMCAPVTPEEDTDQSEAK